MWWKAISLAVCCCVIIVIVIVVVVSTKIARSRVLGIYACCKHNESVDISEKLVPTRFELLEMAC